MIIVSVVVTDEPRASEEEHLKLAPVGEGIQRLIVHIGFMDKPNVPAPSGSQRRGDLCPVSIPTT